MLLGWIQGKVQDIHGSEVIIIPEGIGLGYVVSCPGSLVHTWKVGKQVEIHLYHHITEMSQKLFGFENIGQKKLFIQLISVSGLGPKGALALLELGEQNLASGILNNDPDILAQASGIGPKLAKKIIVELSGKIEDTEMGTSGMPVVTGGEESQIVQTLVNMGYDKKAAENAVSSIPEEMTDLQEKVIFCIKQLS